MPLHAPSPLKIGIRLHDMAPGTLAQRLAAARAQGFCCAHVALSKTVAGFQMKDAPQRLTADFAAQVKQDFDAAGLECALLGCYQQLANPDAEALEKTLACYRAHIRFARMMGARMVGTETPWKNAALPQPVWESEDAFRLFIDGLIPVVRCAEEEGVIMAVEPVFCDIISTPERAERMLDAIHSDHLKIILDAVNLLSNEGALNPAPIVEDALRRLGDRVALVHMKDFRLEAGAGRPVSIACGTGSMRYERLIAFAMEKGLPMTVENTTPENAVATREYLEGIGASLL
ncbi:MAG: sugar phosphate isomerase/epimerase [Clostridia bacterium]|nr:sugar phosphate isomerase/epimerase [Clostridia bacterium]